MISELSMGLTNLVIFHTLREALYSGLSSGLNSGLSSGLNMRSLGSGLNSSLVMAMNSYSPGIIGYFICCSRITLDGVRLK